MTPPAKNGLIVLLKHPEKGNVKTRLAKHRGDDFTLTLYECFLHDLLDTLAAVDHAVHLFLTPPEKIPAFRDWSAVDFPIHPQRGRDLGERMEQAFKHMFGLGYERAVIIGSDMPDLPTAVLDNAFTALDTSAAVIGPSEDGGYYLLGFRRDAFNEAVFSDIPWSTGTVFSETMKILKTKDLDAAVLETRRDVDDETDLQAFIRRNRTGSFRRSGTMKFLLEINRP